MSVFKYFLSASLLMLSMLGISSIAQAQDAGTSRLFKVPSSGVLRVGMTGDYQPMTYRDPKTQEFIGQQVDLANELAKDLGVKLELVATDWKTMINGLQADKYDIAMSGTSMSIARAKTVGMIDSWGMNAFVPIVRKENVDKYKSWDDLNNGERTAGVTLGTTMEDFIRNELPQAQVKSVEAPGSGWQEVLAGRVDYTISTMIEASALQQTHDDLVMILTEQSRNALPMTFLVRIEDSQWIHFLNNWVYLKKTSGFVDQVNKNWGLILKQ
ncbi:transporter substrate-binding domain-containing protein [Mesorhizobium sp. ASY16-5R]|uniref:transporter substrate-binding domain-containing protein n=1 Tax=Mesorhizobium sp. ASY16-5R TaxID=3445772 RepID=UPI003FA0689E